MRMLLSAYIYICVKYSDRIIISKYNWYQLFIEINLFYLVRQASSVLHYMFSAMIARAQNQLCKFGVVVSHHTLAMDTLSMSLAILSSPPERLMRLVTCLQPTLLRWLCTVTYIFILRNLGASKNILLYKYSYNDAKSSSAISILPFYHGLYL